MSDIDELAKPTESASNQQDESIELKPLYQQFSYKLTAMLFTVTVMVGLIATLFYQHNTQNIARVEQLLVPVTQQLQQIEALQNANNLIIGLLNADNADNFVNLHAKLIATNRQLLQLKSQHDQRFQQWLNENKLMEDVVSRIQDSDARNQQLKQSSTIQLQLMLFSLTPIIDKKISHQKTLRAQLQANENSATTTLNRAKEFAIVVQQLHDLQQLKAVLSEILVSFEQLSMLTAMVSFEQLRLHIEQMFAQNEQLEVQATINAEPDISQQINAFEKIVLTEQRALAKWQGYLRLTQEYQLLLKAQQQQISQLLLIPYQPQQITDGNFINNILAKYDIHLLPQQISLGLVIAISFMFLLFCIQLLRLRKKIKVSGQQSVDIIHRSLQEQASGRVVIGNCAETQKIIHSLQRITKPAHNEQEFQVLLDQHQTTQLQLEQHQQTLVEKVALHDEQQLAWQTQMADQMGNELTRYAYLETLTLPIVQHQQALSFTTLASSKYNYNSASAQLTSLYQKLTQFHLSVEMQSEKSVLTLNDINLVDEIHAVLFNKQKEQQSKGNQLFISCDEQLLMQSTLDFRLFEQLFNVLIDIALDNCYSSQLYLHLQLQDKSAGQQQVYVVAKVTGKSFEVLPSLLTQLLDLQTPATSPLINLFTTLLAKQHGSNIVAQLIDEGYQLSFELPLAMTSSANNLDCITLDNRSIMLLSNNSILTEIIKNSVLLAKGRFEKLTRIDSFQQHFSAKRLTRYKLDVLVVDSAMVRNHFDVISQKINELPHSLQPKLMVLQSNELNYDRFGFYSQAEQVFCKDSFLLNLNELMNSDSVNNQLFPCEPFTENRYIESELSLLLAVHSPQEYQNLQRLLQWLGLQVHIVSHEAAQRALWQTGQHNLLITEFAETALIEMASKPLIDVAVFSLTGAIPKAENSAYFNDWHLSTLTKSSTLFELIDALSLWIKAVPPENFAYFGAEASLSEIEAFGLQDDLEQASEEIVITEVAQIYTENQSEAVFDFSQYLHHQGTVELALFMLEDYTQENHHQLDCLIEAIKEKNIEAAKACILALTLNAQILSAQTLQSLCIQWAKIISGSEIPSSLEKVNALLKNTRLALYAIDEYAETI